MDFVSDLSQSSSQHQQQSVKTPILYIDVEVQLKGVTLSRTLKNSGMFSLPTTIKYLHKYVFKGSDKAQIAIVPVLSPESPSITGQSHQEAATAAVAVRANNVDE
eukprot:gene36794-43896_t